MKGSIRPTVVNEAVRQPTAGADDNRENDCRCQHQRGIGDRARVHEQDHQAGDEGHHRADGQIKVAGRNDEGRADGDDSDEGAAGRNVGEVRKPDEVRVHQCADDEQQQERGERSDRPHVHVAPRPAALQSGFDLIAYIGVHVFLPSAPSAPLKFRLPAALSPPSVSSGPPHSA